MKKLFLSVILFFVFASGYAQESKKYIFDKHKGIFKEHEYILYFGYMNNTYLNSNYAILKGQGTMTPEQGVSGGFRFRFLGMLSLDLGGFVASSKATKNANWAYAGDDKTINHRGVDLALSLLLIPHINWFKPYLGVGYQSSELRITESTSSSSTSTSSQNTTAKEVNRIGLSNPYWHFKAFFAKKDFGEIGGEYRQGFGGNYDFQQWQITVGVNLKAFYKK